MNDADRAVGRQWSGRRRRVALGAAGLLVALGGAAAIHGAIGESEISASRGDRAAEPATAAAAPSAGPAASAPASAVTPRPSTTAERIKAMKGRAAKAAADGSQVRQPRPNIAGGPRVAAEDLTIRESGSLREDGRTLRVVSARTDLTGQHELAWIADEGEPVGAARCTQNIQLSNNPEPRVRPTFLLCWRTSAKKSVYTTMVDLKKAPSKRDSVAALARAWAALD